MQPGVVPSLSENGWVTNPAKIIDFIVSYYFLTDEAQTYLFDTNLKSLPATYYRNQNEIERFKRDVKDEITSLLSPHFATIEVNVRSERKVGDENQWVVFISMQATREDGTRYELHKITELENSVTSRVFTFNNFGEAEVVYNALR